MTARGIVGDALQVGPRLAEWACTEHATRIAPALELRDARDLPPTSIWAPVLAELEAPVD